MTTRLLYTGTIAVSVVVLLLVNLLIHRDEGLRDPALRGESVRSTAISAVVAVAVVALSAIPQVSYLAFVLFLVVGRAEGLLRRRKLLPIVEDRS